MSYHSYLEKVADRYCETGILKTILKYFDSRHAARHLFIYIKLLRWFPALPYSQSLKRGLWPHNNIFSRHEQIRNTEMCKILSCECA